MAENWLEILGWTEEQVSDLRLAGYNLVREGQYQHALPFFEGLCALNPLSLFDREMLGALYLQLGEHERAISCFDEALLLDSGSLITQLNRAKALIALGRTDEGLALARLVAAAPEPQIQPLAEALLMAYS